MKTYITAILTTFLTALCFAQQTINVPLSEPNKSGRLELSTIHGGIDIIGYDGTEVQITATTKSLKESKSKNKTNKEGLKRITNSSMEFSVEEYNNTVRINCGGRYLINFEIKVPHNFSLKLSTVNRGDINVNNVNGAIEVSNINGAITLNNISGYVSADSINKDIRVTFNKVEPNATMAFSSLNGDLDISLPSTTKADIKIKTDRGEILTDFDLEANPNQPKVIKKENSGNNTYKVKVENWVTGQINGGGPEFMFKTFNGDIIIRSK